MLRNRLTTAMMLGICSVMVWGSALAAQSASSTSYFMPCAERADGGTASSITYKIEAAVGAGVVGQLTNSPNFKLLGGFNACSQAPIANQVWVSAVRSLYGPISGGTSHTVHGHELNLGATTSVTVGGQPAAVNTRARDNVTITLPPQPVPGWQPVTATNAGGTATLTRAIGILPMADKWPVAIENTQPFRVTYRGQQGDIFYLVVANAQLPFHVPVGSYDYGVKVNLGALIGPPIGPFPVTDPSGEFHLNFPGINFPRPLYVQMLGVSGSAPYAPGSFTNVISL